MRHVVAVNIPEGFTANLYKPWNVSEHSSIINNKNEGTDVLGNVSLESNVSQIFNSRDDYNKKVEICQNLPIYLQTKKYLGMFQNILTALWKICSETFYNISPQL